MNIRELCRRKKTLEERIKGLEESVDNLNEVSHIKVDKNEGTFLDFEWVGVDKILKELLNKLGYELSYEDPPKKEKEYLKQKKIGGSKKNE